MNEIIAAFSKKTAGYPEAERERIVMASIWAHELHDTQLRASGEPYIVHPIGVAEILIELKLDADSIIAALLHDALEDTTATRSAIAERFGEDVALMVDGVTKIAGLNGENKSQQEAESIRKMLFAMVKDVRVILIKLADKLYNMRTLAFLPGERQKSNAQECLDIYAPLADRLGISWIKDELEDLALKHLNRDVYDQIKRIVALKKGERADFLSKVQEGIHREADAAGIRIEVSARAKHFYSIYQKMRKRNKGPDDLFDLLGLRILCDAEDDCYTLLGTVHRLWKPIDGRFKDYIAMPKANGYRSLHTTVMAYDGKLIEIQIRTREMHRIAEYGVASHWLYKKGSTNEIVRVHDLSIVNRLKAWNGLEADGDRPVSSGAFLEDIKRELLKDSIYVFTPKGNVIELPSGSTPIDFAYHIHSAIGDHCVGAKADGSIVPLTSELKNTQVVEILTAQSARPHLNWLRAARTAKARTKIRQWLQLNDDSLIIEREIIAKKKHPPVPVPPAPAHGAEPIQTVIRGQTLPGATLHVRVEDEKNMMIRFAHCCSPVTGDPIIGYVSRGRGIIVHRRNCRNVAGIPDFEQRKIEVEWETASSRLVKRFRVEARRASDLFSEIEGAVRKHQGHLIEGRLEETASNRLTGFFTMELEEKDDLKKVLKNLRGIPSVIAIQTIP
ncbi:MAG TPA: GTP pyrophosphokinase [Treponema sp.]|nr:GTP pyrophosphokinase [Treponema sp.]